MDLFENLEQKSIQIEAIKMPLSVHIGIWCGVQKWVALELAILIGHRSCHGADTMKKTAVAVGKGQPTKENNCTWRVGQEKELTIL